MATEATITIEDSVLSSGNRPVKIIHISGQLDESNVDDKIQQIYKSMEANPKNLSLILDLENLQYMNSKSIGYLTDIYGKITENGGKVTIAKARPNIIDILQVVGLTQLIEAFDTVEMAKAKLESEAIQTVETPAATPAPSTPATPVAPVTATPPEPVVAPAEPPKTTPAPTPNAEAAPAAPVTPVAPVVAPAAPVETPVAPTAPAAATPSAPVPTAPPEAATPSSSEATPAAPAGEGTYQLK